MPSKELFTDLAISIAQENKFHPARERFDELQGKHKGRGLSANWLHTYGGAEDNEYTRAVGLLFLLAVVRRVRKPGAKFDEILVLESEQGANKSSALEILALHPEWFTDNLPLAADSKQVIEATQGKLIIEAAELHGMTVGKTEKLKAFLSRQVDRARMSYGRLPTEVPRQFVIAGTTNGTHYLTDPTGNRRVWPVAVSRFDLEALRRDVDELYAEVAELEAQGASIRLPEHLWKVAAVEQEEPLLKRSVTVFEKSLGPMSPELVKSLGNLAGLYKDQGRYADAAPIAKRAAAIRARTRRPVCSMGARR